MTMLEVQTTLNELARLVNEWGRQFDFKPDVALIFDGTYDDQLTVNGIVLCPIADLDMERSCYDVEYLHIYTTTGCYYEIYLSSFEDGQFDIGYIHKISTVYAAPRNSAAFKTAH